MKSCWFMKCKSAAAFIFTAVLVTACGGGGGDDSASGGGASSGPRFISWSGSSNGSAVLAANNVQVQFLTDKDMYYNGVEYTNVALASASSATVNLGGTPFATVSNAPGTGGTTVAVLYCIGTATLAQIVPTGTTIALNCAAASTSPGGSSSGNTSSGSSGGSTTTNASYGAIAATGNQTHLVGEGIAHDYPTQAAADNAAVSACAKTGVAGCGTVVVFGGAGQCGALAVGNNLAWGASGGNSLTSAEAAAINGCTSVGGQDCSIQLSACN